MKLDSWTRRKFMTSVSTLAAAGITTSLTPSLIHAQTKTDLSGVTIDYWNMIGQQNKLVRELSASIVKAFEQKTGATVNLSWNGYGDIIGPKYRTNFQGGIKPTVFDAFGRWTGQLRGFLRPLDDFIEGAWDADSQNAISWILPLMKRQNSGFPDADQIKDMPFALVTQAPALVRRDHFEKAGIDFDANFPIRDTDHYIQLCKEIQAAGVSKFPTEVYGKIWDFADTQLNGWIHSLDAENSDFLTPDWSQSTATTDAWVQAVQFYVDIFRKHKLSSPQTVQSSDEAAVEEFIRGRKSIVHADILNRGTLLDRAADEMKDGTIRWAPQFPMTGGTSGSQCALAVATFEIVEQEGPDADIKERAGWEFLKEWMLPENQAAYAKVAGMCVRDDVWDSLKGTPDGYAEAAISMIPGAGIWNNHPKSVDIQYNLIAPHGQKMLQGAPVAETLATYAAEVNAALAG